MYRKTMRNVTSISLRLLNPRLAIHEHNKNFVIGFTLLNLGNHGKKSRDKRPDVAEENNSSGASTSASASTSHHGRTWSILNIMKYHHWPHNVKKRLTHKKNAAGKNPDVDGPGGADNLQDYEPNSNLYEEMAVQSTSPAKHSVKARLKALLSDEIARKKGQHKRSSTYPAKPRPPIKAVSIPSLDHSDVNLVSESVPTENNPKMAPHTTETLENLPLACSTANKEICVECGTMFSSGSMEHNSMVHKHQKPPSEYHKALMKETLSCEEKSMHAKLLTTDVSPYLFKDFLDALDMINSNKNLLLKFLQHQHSPLACHFPNQQESARKIRLNKSISFPVPGSSSSSSQFKRQNTNKWQMKCSNQERYKMMVKHKRAIKRFKDLRQKVKHVLEESKNEKRRIAMDAVYDKIPHGNKVPIELKRKIPKVPIDTISPSEFGNFKKRQISPMRTASLNESVWKYSQLYETCFNKGTRYPKSERLKAKMEEKNPILRTPKSFQRFLSLPNLKDYFSQNEEPSSVLPPQIPIRKFGERTASPSTSVDNITTPEISYFTIWLRLNGTESQIKPWPTDGLDHLAEQLQELDIADYHELYVKDVLELSGLSTSHEYLSTWFSNEQPVDPTVYDELEGCLLFDPQSARNEETRAHCNHLILFDLINEVLIEIFGRSYSYYPKSLSSLCHVYPIPVGDQVLGQVWTLIKWYLNLNSEFYPSLDYYVSRDLARSDGWMNLQFDSECVGLELDDLIFDDLLDEIICT
ncbi:protein TRM32-like [Neltuma alba]|uniref:protein TRM32-like n=1 Tax=Neltuma alba TaxID=207710 RepID=UPI0010A3FDFD|nr:protein TRM32-like [Prosopis alba]